MKIDINKIPMGGAVLEEKADPSVLDLETPTVKFSGPLTIRAKVSRITNAVTVELSLKGTMRLNCSRCLLEFESVLEKDIRLGYQADNAEPIIDLDQDIKEETILDYPVKPLCSPDCKGICPKCGKNLNEGGCNCAVT
ncbi:MAG: DUF177 domain-containing protein [Candidatus Omnitrophica bacterium]|nr:DUF177 domain-containing protein [Candidatus Omnitrophota bacterium]MDD5553418.1 DUF177 domain-containing protein [Candidatus Omnitrophota bacterium]